MPPHISPPQLPPCQRPPSRACNVGAARVSQFIARCRGGRGYTRQTLQEAVSERGAVGAADGGPGKGCPARSPGPQPPRRPPGLPRSPAPGTPPAPCGHPGPAALRNPPPRCRTPPLRRGRWAGVTRGGGGGMGQRGWEEVLALLLWRAGAARPSPCSDHSLEERRLLLGGLRGQQLGFCLGRQVLQVVVAPDRSGQELPALRGHRVSNGGRQH